MEFGGMFVVEARVVQEALATLAATLPDVIAIDVAFRTGGFGVCERLRQHSHAERIPIIALAECPSASDSRTRTTDASWDVVLSKPCPAEALISEIWHLVPTGEAVLPGPHMTRKMGRSSQFAAFDDVVELVVLHRLDLLAQVEEQLRGVQHMVRHLERLRSGSQHIGSEPSNAERGDALGHLSDELAVLDRHVATQGESVHSLQGLITRMQERLADLERTATQLEGIDRLQDEGRASSLPS